MSNADSVFTRSSLSIKLNRDIGFSDSDSKEIVNDIIDIILDGIANGAVNIKNIGSFVINRKAARIGRNPKNLKEYPISARNVVKFIASKNLKNAVNNMKETDD